MSHPTTFASIDIVRHIWTSLALPEAALSSVSLPGKGAGLPSSFKVGYLAQASISLSALSAALIHATRNNESLRQVKVPLQHACVEFKSERFYTLDGQPPKDGRSAVGGLHRAADGHVRIHDAFDHHRKAALKLLGLDEEAGRDEIDDKIAQWKALDLETAGIRSNAVIVALRRFKQWDATDQGQAVKDFPILIRKIADGPAGLESRLKSGADSCLQGLRVLEMTRVIAAPVAGRTLAAHGADVLWITSPNLPDLPIVDRDTGRGKRTAQLDVNDESDKKKLDQLLANADVFIQSYRSGSLASKGFSPTDIAAKSKEGIIFGTLSAYGTEGPWIRNRGFDSIVQTCSGLNVAEAEHHGSGEASKVLPCQALDHASGYFLATGIMAALYKQATEGGSYLVEVSLAATMKYLRSLGQFEGKSCWKCQDYNTQTEVAEEFMETKQSAFGSLKAVRHAANVEGLKVGWDVMPKPLGSDDAAWL